MIRWTAMAASVGLVLLWGLLVWRVQEPVEGLGGGPPLALAWAIFTGLAVVAGIGGVRRLPLVTLIAGVVSLVPVGLYFMVLPSPLFRMIGLLDLVVAVAGGIGWARVARTARKPEGRGDRDRGSAR